MQAKPFGSVTVVPKKRGPKKSKGERRSQTGKSIKEMIRPGSRVSTSACSPSEYGAALEKGESNFSEKGSGRRKDCKRALVEASKKGKDSETVGLSECNSL